MVLEVLSCLVGLALAGCGRIDFDSHRDAGTARDDAADAPTPDANPACVLDDGVCTFGCVGIDNDCATTCGDGTCVGNAGEMCVNCQADCMTQSPVCGNGACDPGEAAAGCIADCGPMTWSWVAEEADLLAKLNTVRTAGYTCPNGARPPVGAVTIGVFTAAAREWTWELAHQNFFMLGGTVCNGRTIQDRSQNFTLYQGALLTGGPSAYPTVDEALAKWFGGAAECDALMSPLNTVSIGVAHDGSDAYVVLLNQ